eukprot:6318646-Prymnesium_polylepis.3
MAHRVTVCSSLPSWQVRAAVVADSRLTLAATATEPHVWSAVSITVTRRLILVGHARHRGPRIVGDDACCVAAPAGPNVPASPRRTSVMNEYDGVRSTLERIGEHADGDEWIFVLPVQIRSIVIIAQRGVHENGRQSGDLAKDVGHEV